MTSWLLWLGYEFASIIQARPDCVIGAQQRALTFAGGALTSIVITCPTRRHSADLQICHSEFRPGAHICRE